MNYKVPHFGTDHDMNNSQESIELAERQLGHKWTIKDDPPAPDRGYPVPHFGTDQDNIDVNQSIAAAEKQHGHQW
jgi:hypothetical protein